MEPAPNKLRTTAGGVWEALRHCPHERRAMVFEVTAILGGGLLAVPVLGDAMKAFGRGFAVALQSFSPAVNFDLGDGRPPPGNIFREILLRVGLVTIGFCLLGSAWFAYQSGTLLPDPEAPKQVMFLQDWWNLALYLLVVPLYVSCAVFLIYVTAISWKRINAVFAERVEAKSFWSDSTRVLGFFVVSFALAGLYTANYINDLADPVLTPDLYWFFDASADGQRRLNQAGFYYVFLNAVLLFITAMAAFCYIALSIEIFRFGKFVPDFVTAIEGDSTQSKDAALTVAEAKIQETLDEYAYAYIIAKVLVATYGVNIVIWQMSPAGEVTNVNSAIVALAIIGLIFLVVPRLYLNSKWHRVKFAVLKEAGRSGDHSIGEELKPRRFRRSETWLDAVFLFLLFRAATEQVKDLDWAQELLSAVGAIFG